VARECELGKRNFSKTENYFHSKLSLRGNNFRA